MNEVKLLIQQRKPHVLLIEEANLWKHHDIKQVQVEGYKLYTTSMINNNNCKCSRAVMYIGDKIRAKQVHNLQLEDFSCIWVEVGLPYAKKFLLGGVYREHGHFKLDRNDDSCTSDGESQELRWAKFVDKWGEALDRYQEVVVTGDINIDLSQN